MHPLDAIFCRNVMIYFDKATQLAILGKFAPLLRSDGLLFAGIRKASTMLPLSSSCAAKPCTNSPTREADGRKIIVVGSSTGGTEALKVFLSGMPERAPAILIAQHMPELFTNLFAERLDHLCAVRVKEAEQHEAIVAVASTLLPAIRTCCWNALPGNIAPC